MSCWALANSTAPDLWHSDTIRQKENFWRITSPYGNVYYTFLAFCSCKNHVCTPILTRDMNFQTIQLGPSNIDLRELKIETY